jgi:uncharacterized membrane protein
MIVNDNFIGVLDMSTISDKVTPFAAGFGLYYIAIWIFSFYPAFIIALTLQRMFFGANSESGGTYLLGGLAMIIASLAIVALVAARQYFIVLTIYIITAWPFLYILNHWCHASDSEMYPVPLDWCFLF